MKKTILTLMLSALAVLILPKAASAAGISVSGGSLKYPGNTSSVSITASGTTFNAFQGTISSSGSVAITSCSAGSALWVTQPTGAGGFVGALTSPSTSFRIATCYIKATSVGNGSISVSSVQLANNGPIVATGGGSQSFSIVRQPTPPGTVTVASSSHPDQNTAYEDTTVILNWTAPTTTTTGYAYLFDQAETTDPGSTITNNNLTVTYAEQAIGTYYFHIKAKNGDGWGPATHFKITIKEPDPRINLELEKPHNIKVVKAGRFTNNVKDGTFSGVIITGITEPRFAVNLTLDPMPTLPEGKLLSTQADANGNFSYTIDFPIPAGRYTLTIQGQDNKILTPVSDKVFFEISQAHGGSINRLTSADRLPPKVIKPKWYQKEVSVKAILISVISPVVLIAIILTIAFWRRKSVLKKMITDIRDDIKEDIKLR